MAAFSQNNAARGARAGARRLARRGRRQGLPAAGTDERRRALRYRLVRTARGWDYGGASASLPELLAALRRGDTMVRLGDGSFGLLPEEWLERFAPLANLGSAETDHLRFRNNQAGL